MSKKDETNIIPESGIVRHAAVRIPYGFGLTSEYISGGSRKRFGGILVPLDDNSLHATIGMNGRVLMTAVFPDGKEHFNRCRDIFKAAFNGSVHTWTRNHKKKLNKKLASLPSGFDGTEAEESHTEARRHGEDGRAE